MLIVRGVNLFPTQVEEIVLKIPELAAQYQLVLTRSGNLDELEILPGPRGSWPGRIAWMLPFCRISATDFVLQPV